MNDDNSGGAAGEAPATVGSRWFELGVGLLLMAVAGVVIADAVRVGIGWDEFEGPRAGYFPFRVGCLLMLASGWIVLQQLLRWRREDPVFAERGQLALVWAITWPLALFVALVQPLGIYVSSALLIGYFMRRHGRYRAPALLAVALGVPLFFFVVFERWFLVALPKGPLEALLGL
jgi:hypothetical protein